MEELTASLRPAARCVARRPAQGQRGDILLVVMVFLLVCLLGLVVSMREGIVSTLMGGNNLQRQRNVQVSDIALRQLEGLIQSAAGGIVLNQSATGQPWMRLVSPGTASPLDSSTPNYWDNCLGNSDSTLRCGSITPTVGTNALGYTVLAVVQVTGRGDSTSCQLDKYYATFYDVFLHVKEANGVTSSDTETVYRLCTPQIESN